MEDYAWLVDLWWALYPLIGFLIGFIEVYYWDLPFDNLHGPGPGVAMLVGCILVWPLILLAQLGMVIGDKLSGRK